MTKAKEQAPPTEVEKLQEEVDNADGKLEEKIEENENKIDEVNKDNSIDIEEKSNDSEESPEKEYITEIKGLKIKISELHDEMQELKKDGEIASRTGSKVGAQSTGNSLGAVGDYISKKYKIGDK
jgi:hypothetical protein